MSSYGQQKILNAEKAKMYTEKKPAHAATNLSRLWELLNVACIACCCWVKLQEFAGAELPWLLPITHHHPNPVFVQAVTFEPDKDLKMTLNLAETVLMTMTLPDALQTLCI